MTTNILPGHHLTIFIVNYQSDHAKILQPLFKKAQLVVQRILNGMV